MTYQVIKDMSLNQSIIKFDFLQKEIYLPKLWFIMDTD